MPYERLVQDIVLMKDAGIGVVRVRESTWSLWESEGYWSESGRKSRGSNLNIQQY